jgi:RsiW-degrading membrane proteinase PrsW (M82 family)
MDTNIIPFLGTFVPAALYSLAVYLSMPRRTVPVAHAPLFFVCGILSVLAVKTLYFVFPFLRLPLLDGDLGQVAQMLAQVAPIEELAKFSLFYAALRYFTPQTPQATTLMYMSVGCGFAAAENFSYMLALGPGVLVTRSVTAVLLHMSAGVLAGRMWSKGHRALGLAFAVFLHGAYNSVILVAGDFGAAMMVGMCLVVGLVSCLDIVDPRIFRRGI